MNMAKNQNQKLDMLHLDYIQISGVFQSWLVCVLVIYACITLSQNVASSNNNIIFVGQESRCSIAGCSGRLSLTRLKSRYWLELQPSQGWTGVLRGETSKVIKVVVGKMQLLVSHWNKGPISWLGVVWRPSSVPCCAGLPAGQLSSAGVSKLEPKRSKRDRSHYIM